MGALANEQMRETPTSEPDPKTRTPTDYARGFVLSHLLVVGPKVGARDVLGERTDWA